jgi:ElaB protein
MAQTESQQQAQASFAQDLRNIVDDADQLLKNAVKSGDAQFNAMRDRFEAQLHRMRRQLDDFEDTTVHTARQAARYADEAVRTHPYAAIGIGAAAGLVIGFLIARR